ncbi:MAG: hypothetical protein ACYC3G_03435 [Minisyncoccota bacterium]
MKLISFVLLLVFLNPMAALPLDVSFKLAIGKKPVKKAVTMPKKTNTKEKVSVKKDEVKNKPEWIKKTEKALKVNKPIKKKDWLTLSADGIGALGITYGLRKSNWAIGSMGTAALAYGLFSKRNTNTFTSQAIAIGTGIGGGYLIKIKPEKDEESNNALPPDNSVVIPPPPAP